MKLNLRPLLLLPAMAVLAACTASPETPITGGGAATASVITVVPAGTTIPGIIPNGTFPAAPSPQPVTAIPSLPSASLLPTELKYRVLDQYPDFFYCDPDFYPIARADEADLARQRFPEVQANAEEFQAILAHNGLAGQSTFSDEQKQLIYREHKKLTALRFQLAGQRYQFQFTSGGEGKQSFAIQGSIDGAGYISIEQRTPTFATCPICLAVHTRIATPDGAVLVEGIRAGDVVWTMNAAGERVAAPVLKVVRVPVSSGHELIHLRLDDGRELWASAGHPMADGRVLAELHVGDRLDGAFVVSAAPFSYDGGATYDLLPAGGTGFYWADGILLGSTLRP